MAKCGQNKAEERIDWIEKKQDAIDKKSGAKLCMNIRGA